MKKSTWQQGMLLGALLLAVIGLGRLEKNAGTVKITKETEPVQTETVLTETSQTETEMPILSRMENKESDCIRVLIRSDDFVSAYHEEIDIRCLENAKVQVEMAQKEYEAGQTFRFFNGDELENGTVLIFNGTEGNGSFQLVGLERGYENPVYEGQLEVHKTEKGYLIINELPLEEYLTKVVPSEMPSYYPIEALKAQAVCARTYAVKQLLNPRMEEGIPADVDDSVSYQVYNNQPAQESCTQAIRETEGLMLTKDGELLDALYYSTSCGVDLSRDLSLEAVFCAFLSVENETDYEKEEPWYRWNTFFSADYLKKLTEEAGLDEIGEWKELILGSREESGRLLELTVKGTLGEKQIIGEYQIRKFLNPKECTVTLQNGQEAPDLGLLPSAYFYLVPSYEETQLLGYQVIGGGYGHGNGMSQNGAANMAEEGMNFEEILSYYYGEIELHDGNDTEH